MGEVFMINDFFRDHLSAFSVKKHHNVSTLFDTAVISRTYTIVDQEIIVLAGSKYVQLTKNI